MIRNSSKVILLRDGKILLNQCRHSDGRVYYDLPGGGQHRYETMEEAAIREVKEETGYTVSHLRFAALGEEICSDPVLREQSPEYTHRIFHIFIAELDDRDPESPTEYDLSMEDSAWVSVKDLQSLPELYPQGLVSCISEILNGKSAIYLGSFLSDASFA